MVLLVTKNKNQDKIKVFIVDDHPIVRDGLRVVIQGAPQLHFSGEAGDGEAALNAIDETVDVVLLDLNMPKVDGIQVMKRLQTKSPNTKVIFITLNDEEQHALRLHKMGANGFIHKTSETGNLIEAIRRVHGGGSYFSNTVVQQLLNSHRTNRPSAAAHESLSSREFEIVSMIARKMSASEIADKLSISRKTVSTHQANIVKKLGLTKNRDIVFYAIEHRLIE